MPIRPENKDRYPRNWQKIRLFILERAQNRCERCGVENGDEGYRDEHGRFHSRWESPEAEALSRDKPLRIVLTIDHLDQRPENNAPENLMAMCQRCHNRHDIVERVKGRRQRRWQKIGQFEMPLGMVEK